MSFINIYCIYFGLQVQMIIKVTTWQMKLNYSSTNLTSSIKDSFVSFFKNNFASSTKHNFASVIIMRNQVQFGFIIRTVDNFVRKMSIQAVDQNLVDCTRLPASLIPQEMCFIE